MLSKISKQSVASYINNKAAIAKMLIGSRTSISRVQYHTFIASQKAALSLLQTQSRGFARDN